MRSKNLFGLGAGLLASGALGVAYAAYIREMRAILASLAATGQSVHTTAGRIEYAREGTGPAVLVIHGAGGGHDQGTMLGRELLSDAFDIIAPSRFGYLATPVPEDASPAAQADAHMALLDSLDVQRAILVGVSAGAPSAIELALRHPDRVSALILIVPRAYAPGVPQVSSPAKSELMLKTVMSGADFPFWLASKVARRSLIRFLGITPEVEATAPARDRRRVTKIIRSILPLSQRIIGLQVDAAADIRGWPLYRIAAPTLIISAEDDLYGTLAPARYTAAQIPGAELMVLPSGGHLMIGHVEQVRARILSFIAKLPALKPWRHDLNPCPSSMGVAPCFQRGGRLRASQSAP